MTMALKKILVVDDREEIRQLLADILRLADYECSVVDNGYDALKLVIGQAPDLLITDLSMPRMDGYELCQRVREISNLPIVMVTSLGVGREILARATRAGANVVLSKPFDISELLARISELLRD